MSPDHERADMRILVQKFGGSSLAGPERVRAAAARVVEAKRSGYDVVAVVSAMAETTEELLSLARGVSCDPEPRELDRLLATGEIASAALLAMALRDLGERAVSLSGGASGIVTNDVHGNARILEVRLGRLRALLDGGAVVVVAGYQGVDAAGEVTTLGRGGSDTTAVALAAALGAQRCEILTDVDGVFSADPRLISEARQIDAMSSGELEELAWNGAQVVKAEAVELAADHGVRILVSSTFGDGQGTLVHPAREDLESFRPRRPEVAGVSGRKDLMRLALKGGMSSEARIELSAALACYDLVFGAVAAHDEPAELFLSTLEMTEPYQVASDLSHRFDDAIEAEPGLGAVTIVGFGLGSRPQALFDAACRLAELGVHLRRSFTARESLSFVVPADEVDGCVRVLHEAYVEKVSGTARGQGGEITEIRENGKRGHARWS